MNHRAQGCPTKYKCVYESQGIFMKWFVRCALENAKIYKELENNLKDIQLTQFLIFSYK